MSNCRDRTGEKYGRWTVLSREANRWDGAAQWLCRCDCGNERIVTGRDLYNGRTQSCGCLRSERMRERIAARPVKLPLSRASRWPRLPAIPAVRPLPRPLGNAQRDTVIVRLFKGGRSFNDIAKQEGVSRSVVAGAVWRARRRGELEETQNRDSP